MNGGEVGGEGEESLEDPELYVDALQGSDAKQRLFKELVQVPNPATRVGALCGRISFQESVRGRAWIGSCHVGGKFALAFQRLSSSPLTVLTPLVTLYSSFSLLLFSFFLLFTFSYIRANEVT